MDYGRRVAVERDSSSAMKSDRFGRVNARANVIFDESSNFILFSTLFGIQLVNLHTKEISFIFGKNENARFSQIAMFQVWLQSS